MDMGLDWPTLLLEVTAVSFVALIATAIAVPLIVARLPPDYFLATQRSKRNDYAKRSALKTFLAVLRNLVGVILALLGLVMLVTPGQGLLTLMAGLLLMNFPGKYRLERWLVLRPGILRGLNWLRKRRHQPPFEAPAQSNRSNKSGDSGRPNK